MPGDEFPEALLAEVVAEHVDAAPDALRLRRIPTGKYNTSYTVDGAAIPLVLRIAPEDDPALHLFYEYRMMRQEPALHAAIQSRTSVPVPNILAHQALHPRLRRDFLVMERCPGEPLSDHPGLDARALERVLGQIGDALSQVHAITADRYGYLGDHAPMQPQEGWAGAFEIMWNKLLDNIEACGGYSGEEADSFRRLLDTHLKVFDRQVDSSLLHMDVWAQNILVAGGGTLSALVDWDRALWGDPEIEFAVLDYCGISTPAFWEGYGRLRDTGGEAQIRHAFYYLYELQKYIFIRRVRGRSPQTADRYRRQALALAAELGAA